MENLFAEHLQSKVASLSQLLQDTQYDSAVIATGSPSYYFQDDQTKPFKPNPNFSLFCPERSSEHLLQVIPGQKPRLAFYKPRDFWHDTSTLESPFWAPFFDIFMCGTREDLWKTMEISQGSHVFIGENTDSIHGKNLQAPDPSFFSALHWSRIEKSEYEIHCIREANSIAARGHRAARDAFYAGASEREINFQYLLATDQFENELPYQCITALDEKAAVLHYHGARSQKNGKVFLIDAGATFNGYCSDISRTYCTKDADPLFAKLLQGIDKIQKNVSVQVLPGFNYLDLHVQAKRNIGKLLLDCGIFTGISLDAVEAMDLVSAFFPHGLGHSLGLQVHDVGGKQLDASGTVAQTDEKNPYLRTLRKLQNNEVVTIEPGVYFIPMLLKPIQEDSTKTKHIHWESVSRLMDHGGIRIEDNVVARASGAENLTRAFLVDEPVS